jgi:L-alanine-DL-glutamate epimerase-like enolase superfamily enzyme
MPTRRDLLRTATAGALATLPLPRAIGADPDSFRATTGVPASSDRFLIRAIERITCRIPFREIPRRAMDRELPHWRYVEIVRVTLASGAIGFGETQIYYTWGATSDEDVARAQGAHAVELMWDDSLGSGLQMALFDAVGKTAGVPVHRLLGPQRHERTPLAWWNIDMPPEDMAAECLTAFESGYMAYKTKGRPWFDIWEQVRQIATKVPSEFKVDMDFNDTLLDAERAIPICQDLEKTPQIDIYETPIPQRDVEGNAAIRAATRVQIAMHYGSPRPATVIRSGCCDGFVVGGGASRVMRQGAFAAEVDMPFWLQLVGTGLTAAYSLHFGAVLKQAVWPAVNCHQLYEHDLLSLPIQVAGGTAAIPAGPGIGVEVDWAVVDRYRVDPPTQRPNPPRLLEVSWKDGRRMVFASSYGTNFVVGPCAKGAIATYEPGVTARLWPQDGSTAWQEIWDQAQGQPLRLN